MFTGKRCPKILKTIWVGEDGFNVMGGFRISKFTQGLGISVMGFGIRLTFMLWSFRPKDWIAYIRTYGIVEDTRRYDPPFNGIKLLFGPLCVLARPAYGGYLSKRGS